MSWVAAGVATVAAGTSAYSAYNAGKSKGGDLSSLRRSGPPKTAADIRIDPSLQATLGQTGKSVKGSLQDVFGKVRSQYNADASGRGVKAAAPGSYFDTRMGTAQDFANAGVDNSLASVLGNTATKQAISDRDYGQNYDLAKYVGSLNRPSSLEEALSGLGAGARAGGQIYGLSSSGKSPKAVRDPNTDPSLSLFDPGSSGYARYQ